MNPQILYFVITEYKDTQFLNFRRIDLPRPTPSSVPQPTSMTVEFLK